MDFDLMMSYRQATEPEPDRTPAEWAQVEEWRGTGLCPQAQADGVPCTELGRSCDICTSADSSPASEGRIRP